MGDGRGESRENEQRSCPAESSGLQIIRHGMNSFSKGVRGLSERMRGRRDGSGSNWGSKEFGLIDVI